MNKKVLVALIICCVESLSLAQVDVVPAGGSVKTKGGSVTISLGQPFSFIVVDDAAESVTATRDSAESDVTAPIVVEPPISSDNTHHTITKTSSTNAEKSRRNDSSTDVDALPLDSLLSPLHEDDGNSVLHVHLHPAKVIPKAAVQVSMRISQSPCTIYLYDLQGRLLWSESVHSTDTIFHAPAVSGIYTVMLRDTDGNTASARMAVVEER